MTPNTQHLPGISADMTGGDIAAERFRACIGTTGKRRLPAVPAEWQHAFTPETWADYEHARFDAYFTHAAMLSPAGYLANRS